jgi:ribosomal protein S30
MLFLEHHAQLDTTYLALQKVSSLNYADWYFSSFLFSFRQDTPRLGKEKSQDTPRLGKEKSQDTPRLGKEKSQDTPRLGKEKSQDTPRLGITFSNLLS